MTVAEVGFGPNTALDTATPPNHASRPSTVPSPPAVFDTSSPPVRMHVLGRDVTVEPVGLLADGSMELPASPHTAGWWAPGAAPGDAAGTVVVAGHVDTAADGPGIFAQIAAGISTGSNIILNSADGQSWHYVVTERRHHDKAALPADLFARTGAPRLALITCTGPFDEDAGGYTRNLVVIAEPGS